jgi:hypothetical protein
MKDTHVLRFLTDLRGICKEKDVKLFLPNSESVAYSDKIRTIGFFGGDPLTLACARKSPVFIEVLVHESCHLDQYFDDYNFFNKGENSDLIDEWLLGKEIKNIEKHIEITREIELDCEKRAVRKILKYQLPININHYIQKSNAYVWFHNYMCKKRFWPIPEEFPYNVIEIWSKMPATFQSNYSILPLTIENIFNKRYSSQLKYKQI